MFLSLPLRGRRPKADDDIRAKTTTAMTTFGRHPPPKMTTSAPGNDDIRAGFDDISPRMTTTPSAATGPRGG
jgi:hypothetical protein